MNVLNTTVLLIAFFSIFLRTYVTTMYEYFKIDLSELKTSHNQPIMYNVHLLSDQQIASNLLNCFRLES